MINLGTFIICCALCLFAGMAITDQKEQNRYLKHIEDMRTFYYENTRSLVAYIEKLNKEKGGE